MRFRRPQYRGIAPLTADGRRMSGREYEAWRDARAWDPSRTTGLTLDGMRGHCAAGITPSRGAGPRVRHFAAHAFTAAGAGLCAVLQGS